jgi:biopolymer transport protein ExbD
MARRQSQSCSIDMTPMIDVVFQLIIFFIVAITMSETMNEDVKLEWGKNGPLMKGSEGASVIEINRFGWVSMSGAQITREQLFQLLKNKYARMGGEFPVFIRADYRTRHQDVRAVMDMCTAANLWKIDFVAMKRDYNNRGRGL